MNKLKKLKVDYTTSLKIQLEKLGIKTWIDLDKIENLHKPPEDSYIYDIEDGEEMLGKSPKDCEKEFKTQNRRALTVHEVLAIYRKNKKVLNNHYIDCTGSRPRSADYAPFLWLSGGRPKLDWDDVDHENGKWGSPSCGSKTGSSDIGNLELLETRVLDLEHKMEKLVKIINI